MHPDEIQHWLKKRRLSRTWLAGHLYVSVNTVNGWLSSGKNISSQRALQLREIMDEYDGIAGETLVAEEGDLSVGRDRITIDVQSPTFDLWNQASVSSGELMKEWIIRNLTILARNQLGL